MKKKITHRYKCTSSGAVNNGRKNKCDFEMVFDKEASYNCPICGHPLKKLPNGPSIVELLLKPEGIINGFL